jgi:uncharacterized hydrophobic protein (TIGR00341 family)
MAHWLADNLDAELITLVILTGIVGLIGLFMNNIPIIIGAMVISPLMAPIHLSAISLAKRDIITFLKHMTILLILLAIMVFTSALITYMVSRVMTIQLTREIISYVDINFLYILLAIALGITVIVADRRGFLSNVIGIWIAIALVPPTVVAGIMIVINPDRSTGAFVVMLYNIVGLLIGMLAALLVLKPVEEKPVKKK